MVAISFESTENSAPLVRDRVVISPLNDGFSHSRVVGDLLLFKSISLFRGVRQNSESFAWQGITVSGWRRQYPRHRSERRTNLTISVTFKVRPMHVIS
jgi:hypothetical protein